VNITIKIHILFFLLIVSVPLLAKEEASSARIMSIAELLKVKVTGSTLTQENRITVPAAVTVFSYGDITHMGIDYLDELANLVPGFQSYRTAGTPLESPISSRGRRIDVAGAEILMLVDGQRVDGPRSNGIGIILPKFPLMHAERVEFIRGPGAAVYGSNAMMGIINIVTRSDVDEVSISYGSFNRRQVTMFASPKIGDLKMDLFAYIEADDGDNYWVSDTFGPNPIDTDDPRKLGALNIKVLWHNTQIAIQHNQFKAENFYELDGISNGFNQREGRLSSILLRQNFNGQSLASWILLSYKESKVNLSGQLTGPGALATISDPSSDESLFVNAEFDDYGESRIQWHNAWDINVNDKLQFGIEVRHINAPEAVTKNNFDLGDLANFNFPIRYYGTLRATTPVQASSRRDIVGVYSQYQRQLSETTHLTAGLRYDNFSSISSEISPRLGLVHEVNQHNSFKLLYGAAFRAPAEAELHLINNPVLLGNHDLKPETVQSWDLIWVGQWVDTALSLGYFENHFTDSIVQTPNASGLLQYDNVDQDPTKGFEFELSKQLSRRWLVRASYTYFNEKSDISFREAEQLVSLMVNYQHNNWNANLIATWHDKRDVPAVDSNGKRITLDDSQLFLAKLSYNLKAGWQGFVQIKNILDKDYATPTIGALVPEGVPNRGREILVGISSQF
jgi:outer membrane cobalamin receptor